MDLRAPGVRAARFPQTPGKVYSSTCQSRTPPPLQTVVLAHTSPHYPRYTNVPVHMHSHTPFSECACIWSRPHPSLTLLASSKSGPPGHRVLPGTEPSWRSRKPCFPVRAPCAAGSSRNSFTRVRSLLYVLSGLRGGKKPSLSPKHQNKQPNEMHTQKQLRDV